MPAKEQYGEKFCNDLISMRMGFSMPGYAGHLRACIS